MLLAVALGVSGCANAEEARAVAERGIPQVEAAIAPIAGHGLQFTVTAESGCSEGCSGAVVIKQTAGQLRVADVIALHEAVRDIKLDGTFLSSTAIVLSPADPYRLVGFEAGFCSTGGNSFGIQNDPNPECMPRTPTPTPSATDREH
ncbi:hypothetical protein ACRAWB_02320 [Leifsonia poae]|uniref:hypothetical protein n=1 Tax=Leifsonia poae TaxID=110933 RepID=UPI003D687E40